MVDFKYPIRKEGENEWYVEHEKTVYQFESPQGAWIFNLLLEIRDLLKK